MTEMLPEPPQFNLPLLRKAVEWAESEASKSANESQWCQQFFAVDGEEIGRDCGTAYCIAGWVIHEHAEGEHAINTHDIDGEGEAPLAQELLGIDEEDAWGNYYQDTQGLFGASNSIEDVRRYAEQIARKYGQEL